uniref:C3H1-type domain-containing protein n=1 Tax=Timema shepardi TaxID=629360 RepID=A0A7R9AW80_TIMSH|nr:unnamed protein product [Timema shepardi]
MSVRNEQPVHDLEFIQGQTDLTSTTIVSGISSGDVVKLMTSSWPKNIIELGRTIKVDFMREKAKLRNTNSVSFVDVPAHNIYLNEHLTASNRKKFAEARKQRDDGKFAFVWVKNGCIYIREEEGKPAVLYNEGKKWDVNRNENANGTIAVGTVPMVYTANLYMLWTLHLQQGQLDRLNIDLHMILLLKVPGSLRRFYVHGIEAKAMVLMVHNWLLLDVPEATLLMVDNLLMLDVAEAMLLVVHNLLIRRMAQPMMQGSSGNSSMGLPANNWANAPEFVPIFPEEASYRREKPLGIIPRNHYVHTYLPAIIIVMIQNMYIGSYRIRPVQTRCGSYKYRLTLSARLFCLIRYMSVYETSSVFQRGRKNFVYIIFSQGLNARNNPKEFFRRALNKRKTQKLGQAASKGTCPFGNKCFYRHAYPDGTTVDVGPPKGNPRRRRRQRQRQSRLQGISGADTIDHADCGVRFVERFHRESRLHGVFAVTKDHGDCGVRFATFIRDNGIRGRPTQFTVDMDGTFSCTGILSLWPSPCY